MMKTHREMRSPPDARNSLPHQLMAQKLNLVDGVATRIILQAMSRKDPRKPVTLGPYVLITIKPNQ